MFNGDGQWLLISIHYLEIIKKKHTHKHTKKLQKKNCERFQNLPEKV